MKTLTQALLAIATAGLAILSAHAAGAPTDFDGDGKSDILWRNAATGENYIYFMDGKTIHAEGFVRTVSDLNWKVVGIGYFNGGVRADILWRNSSTGENYLYLMNGTTIANEGNVRTIADQNWQVAGLGDFDGNGRADVLWRNRVSGENYIYLMTGTTIAGEGYVRTIADQNWQIAGVGDFDGDGKSDILWRNAATGENYVYFMDGLSIVHEGYLRAVADQNWQVAGVGDFNGDGTADILWRNVSTGENYLYPMDGLTILGGEGYLRTVSDLAWQVAATGDYDGDGKYDIFWRNASTGENYLYPMDGTTIKPTEGYIRTVTDLTWLTWQPTPVTDTAAPTTPTGLAATPVSATRIGLSWTASTDNVAVTGYRVYRNGALLTTTPGNVTTYESVGLTASTAYTYTVDAIDAAENASARSAAASATTLAPNTATLAWDAVIHPAVTGYRVYFGTAPGTYSQTANVGNVTTRAITGLTSGQRYYFAVRARDALNNESAFSNEVFKDIP